MASAADAVADFRTRLLRLDVGAEAILPAAAAWPEDPMVQMCAAAFCLYGQTAGDQAAAGRFIAAAETAGAAGARPDLFRGMRLWHAQQYDAAATAMEAATRVEPGDLLPLKLCECLYYDLGQQFSGPRYRDHTRRLAPVHGGNTDFLAMHSFAHELCGDFAQARALAEAALELEPRNPWAQHTLSHVTIRLGSVDEGERRLRAFLPVAATCSRPIHSHTAWHLALFDVERLDHARALQVYRSDIWGFTPDSVFEQVDAIALLWRIELAGGDVGQAWSEVAQHVQARCQETFMPFLSAHHAYALARAERSQALAALLEAVALRASAPDAGAWRSVGQSVVRAAVASGQRRWADAAALLDPVMHIIGTIGGSDAQDDLFRQMHIVALARSGRSADAQRAIEAANAPGKHRTELDRYFAKQG